MAPDGATSASDNTTDKGKKKDNDDCVSTPAKANESYSYRTSLLIIPRIERGKTKAAAIYSIFREETNSRLK